MAAFGGYSQRSVGAIDDGRLDKIIDEHMRYMKETDCRSGTSDRRQCPTLVLASKPLNRCR